MESFSKSIKNFKNKKSKSAYFSCIDSFEAYMNHDFDYSHIINDDSKWDLFLNKFTGEHFKEALKKYVNDSQFKNKPIKVKSRVLTYKSVFNEYIRFLDKSGYDCFKLLNIIRREDIGGIEFITQRFICDIGLADKRDCIPPISKEKMKSLFIKCNEILSVDYNQIISYSKGKNKNKNYNDYLKCLIIKYMMTFGLKCECINQIIYTPELENGMIKLNNNIAELPPHLKEQTKEYLKARTKILIENERDIENTPLFILRNGKSNNSQNGNNNENISSNQFYVNYLKTLVNKIGLQCTGISFVTYRAIMNMIEISTPKSIITSTTGYDNSAYNTCLMHLQNEGGSIPDTLYCLNYKYRTLDLYGYM